MPLRVAEFGVRIANGKLFSSATRTISRRIASEIESPICFNASAALSLVFRSIRGLHKKIKEVGKETKKQKQHAAQIPV